MSALFDSLPAARRLEVMSAVAAVEAALHPVPAREFRALAEPTLRPVVEQVLARSGRVLIEAGGGYLSGYADDVSAELVGLGIGVLPATQRAVLAMVLLLSVAVPRAEGRLALGDLWTRSRPVSPDMLGRESELAPGTIDSAMTALRVADLVKDVAGGVVPGPQFRRLTDAAVSHLFEELILLAEPQGDLALSIKRLRAMRAAGNREEQR
ncbi:hypothetical protein ACFU44_10820 [Nocardia rhizosphaerihabitans]|uniref:hypothetical protein n=1 Tax=Nocardia rhizosphaerihabitans TaxID=1691570 RepID=UPI00366C33C4